MIDLSGKKVFITGVSRGIGLAIAKELKSVNAYIVGTCRGPSDEDLSFIDEVKYVDFLIDEEIQSIQKYLTVLKPDILINNAGINKVSEFEKIDYEDFYNIQKVNVFAPFMMCQSVIPGMKERGWGRIVNISSIWGKISKEYRASYSSSKFAIDGLTVALSNEHAKHGILANCIAPGFTDTELTRKVLTDEQITELTSLVPIKRMAQVSEIAKFAVWLSSDENTYITGQNIAIDGGFTRA